MEILVFLDIVLVVRMLAHLLELLEGVQHLQMLEIQILHICSGQFKWKMVEQQMPVGE